MSGNTSWSILRRLRAAPFIAHRSRRSAIKVKERDVTIDGRQVDSRNYTIEVHWLIAKFIRHRVIYQSNHLSLETVQKLNLSNQLYLILMMNFAKKRLILMKTTHTYTFNCLFIYFRVLNSYFHKTYNNDLSKISLFNVLFQSICC